MFRGKHFVGSKKCVINYPSILIFFPFAPHHRYMYWCCCSCSVDCCVYHKKSTVCPPNYSVWTRYYPGSKLRFQVRNSIEISKRTIRSVLHSVLLGVSSWKTGHHTSSSVHFYITLAPYLFCKCDARYFYDERKYCLPEVLTTTTQVLWTLFSGRPCSFPTSLIPPPSYRWTDCSNVSKAFCLLLK